MVGVANVPKHLVSSNYSKMFMQNPTEKKHYQWYKGFIALKTKREDQPLFANSYTFRTRKENTSLTGYTQLVPNDPHDIIKTPPPPTESQGSPEPTRYTWRLWVSLRAIRGCWIKPSLERTSPTSSPLAIIMRPGPAVLLLKP